MLSVDQEIQAAAQQSLAQKSMQLNEWPSHPRQMLSESLQPFLLGQSSLSQWLTDFSAGAVLPQGLDVLSAQELEALSVALNGLYRSQFPGEAETELEVQEMALLDFDEVPELSEAGQVDSLKPWLWLLCQIVPAYYFVHHFKA